MAVNACIFPICLLDGLAVTTIEGIGSTRTKLHPCQVKTFINFLLFYSFNLYSFVYLLHFLIFSHFFIQEHIARCHGTQCGFCTPGMIMSMYTLLRNNPQPSELEIQQSLHGTKYVHVYLTAFL